MLINTLNPNVAYVVTEVVTSQHLLYPMKKTHVLFFIVFLLGKISSAQFPGGLDVGGSSAPKIFDGKISGKVAESLNGKPIEFANIALYQSGSEKPTDGTVTDDKGFFKLKNIHSSWRLCGTRNECL